TAAARAEVIRALAELNLQAADAVRTYRPPEGPLVAAAPRSVLQVAIPNDTDHGFIVLYAFDSPSDAAEAARDHARYVGSNVGRSQFPFGTRFVIRVVGATVVFFHWSPQVSTDELTPLIEQGLLRIGSGVPVQG
ncbi:MAG TPA: hypothetical protein VNL94_06070, partial [Candidatus Binatia bacterium]|nr:hypothetical protein [Candidatus Binatia bacterium]